MSNLPAAQQGAWLSLAEAKNNLAADLTKRELEMQGVLPDLAAYRKMHSEMVEKRKSFTNIINDKLIAPMMEWEKRADPKTNAAYLAAAEKELAERKAATEKLERDQAIAAERGQFKAHFQNEYMRLATAYRHSLAGIIQQCYASCLGAMTPPDQVHAAMSIAEQAMDDVKPGMPNKFNRVYLTPEDAATLYKQLKPPSWNEIRAEASEQLKEKFSMYANDLAHADVALQDSQREFEATIIEDVQDLQQEQAANVLMASAEAFVLPDTGFKPVVELEKIVIEDNSEGWVVKIMSAFLANFQQAFNKTRNKKYSSLTVAQIAAALDAANIRVQGVQYTKVVK